MSRRPLQAPRAAAGCPEASAETSVTALNASTGCQRGQGAAARARGSRRRQSQRRVSRTRAVSDRVMDKPRPRTNAPKAPRRSTVKSVGVAIEEHANHGQHDDLKVAPERPALDVLDVVLDALLQRGVPPQPVHLRPPRDAGLDLVAKHVAGNGPPEALHEDRSLRSWADGAHLPAQHVHELRQLIQTEAPQEG